MTAINITNPGSGYDNNTTVSVSGGSGIDVSVTTGDKEAVPAVFEEMYLEVPILTMLPIPFIRVEEGEIDFHAKITSMEYSRVGTEFKGSTSFGYNSTTSASSSSGGAAVGVVGSFIGAGYSSLKTKLTSSVNFRVNASYQKTSKQGNKVDKEYQLGVKIKVSQDEIPAGMEKLLGILEDAIVAQPIQ